jgi:CRISPR-associated protein Csb1
MSNEQTSRQYDEWLTDNSSVAALVMRQWLVPVEGRDAVIFPPTYAKPERSREEDWLGYNIDPFSNGTNVCQIDSVGSQANRIEPIFKREEYRRLVPQIVITAGERQIHLLDAGHRAADAIVRFSSLAPQIEKAFRAWKDKGNAEPLARVAPTSIVFGSWDSRSTQAKLPRIVRSVIRAYGVELLHRSAQYSTIAGEILEGPDVEVTTKGPKAELGLAHVPAPWTHGGVEVRGEIRRDGILNLSALRALGADSDENNDIRKLRRYILGLALVSFTAPQETFLREGCQLVSDPDRVAQWKLVRADGSQEDYPLTHDQALVFAKAVAEAFGVAQESIPASFDPKLASHVLSLSEADRKKLFKQGPVTWEAIEQLKKGSKSASKKADGQESK